MSDLTPAAWRRLLVVRAQNLAELRLRQEPLTAPLIEATSDRQSAYLLLCCLSREIGTLLRPAGHDGSPIGIPATLPGGPAPALLVAGQAAALRDLVASARLIGSAAAGDVQMVGALALAVVAGPDAVNQARNVARDMLDVLAETPIDPRRTP